MTVTVTADGSFFGTGQISGDDGTNSMTNYPETVHGQINAGRHDQRHHRRRATARRGR